MSAQPIEQHEQPRLRSFQDFQVAYHRHVYALAKKDIFKGHACAQAVYQYDLFNVAFRAGGNRRPGYVMEGCVYPAAVAKATSYTARAVEKARAWLHEQRFEESTDNGLSVRPLSLDDQTEENRLKLLAELGPAEPPELRTGPKNPKSIAQIEPEAQPVTNSVRNYCELSSQPEPGIANSVRTYSSRSSSTSQITHRGEPPAAAFLPVDKREIEEEEKKNPGADAGDPHLAYTRNPGNDRPDLPDNGLHWYVDTRAQRYRPAVGRGRPKGKEILFDGTENDLIELYGPRFTGPDGLADDDEAWLFGDNVTELSPARNRPQGGGYDNHFWMGVSKGGDPYFSRVSRDRPGRKSEREVRLTKDEASQLMTLKGAEHLDHRQKLHAKYSAG